MKSIGFSGLNRALVVNKDLRKEGLHLNHIVKKRAVLSRAEADEIINRKNNENDFWNNEFGSMQKLDEREGFQTSFNGW